MSRLNVVTLLAAFVVGVGVTAGLVLLLVKNPPPAELLGFLGNLLGAVMASAITIAGGYFLFRHQQQHTAKIKLAMLGSKLGHLRQLFEALKSAPEEDKAAHNKWLHGVPENQAAISALAETLSPDADFPYRVNVALGLLSISVDKLIGVEAITSAFDGQFRFSHTSTVTVAAADALAKLNDLEQVLPQPVIK